MKRPINIDPVQKRLKSRDRSQAERTAWRLVLRWVQAQLAMIETGMVSAPEVFYPYTLIQDAGTGRMRTVFEDFIDSQLKALPAGKPE